MKKGAFEKWIFESYSPTAEGLALYRIFGSLFILFFLLPEFSFYSVLANYPDDFFAPPPGPMSLFYSFPPEYFLKTIHIILVLSWTAVLVGYKTKAACVLAGLSMLVLQGFLFSLGKINHEILLSVTPIVMAFSNWGAVFSVDQHLDNHKQEPQGWPFVLLALLIGFMMFTAGVPKILGGWLDPATQATQGHLLNQFYVRNRQEFLSLFAVQVDSVLLWEFLDWATVIFEISFLVAVLKSSWTRFYICLAVLFHFSTMMTLNIAFLINFLAYAAFLKWDWVYEKISSHSINMSLRKQVFLYSVFLAFIFATIRFLSDRGFYLTPEEPNFYEFIFLSVALAIVILIGIRKGRLLLKNRIKQKTILNSDSDSAANHK